MADTSTWTAITGANNPVEVLGATVNLTAGAAIKRNMVVAFAATGVSETVQPAVSGTTGPVVGVALNDAASGEKVVVAISGSVVIVREGAGAALDAGDWVAADDAAATGCVKALDTTATNYDRVGQLIDDLAANGLARIIISTGPTTKAAS